MAQKSVPDIAPPPHAERLIGRLRKLTHPLIQLWAWPGSGQRNLLRLLAREVAAEDPARGAGTALARSLGKRERSSWLIWDSLGAPPWSLVEVARTGAGRQLLFTGRMRWFLSKENVVQHLRPGELLLTEAEVAQLVRDVVPGVTSQEVIRRLWLATEGWLRPLELALAAGAAKGRPEPTAEALLQVPAMMDFFREQVLGPMPPPFPDLLLELSAGETLDPGFWRELWQDEGQVRALQHLVEVHGLVTERSGGALRLPRLLTAFLRWERGRLWPSRRSFALFHRLALADYSLGRPASALRSLVEGGDPLRRLQLIELDWLTLLADTPATWLRKVSGAVPLPIGSPGRLLGLAAEGVLGSRRVAREKLCQLLPTLGEATTPLAVVAERVLWTLEGRKISRRQEVATRQLLLEQATLPSRIDAWLASLADPSERLEPQPPAGAPLGDHLRALARGAGLSLSLDVAGTAPDATPPRPEASASPVEDRLSFRVRLLGIPQVIRRAPSAGAEARDQEISWPLRRAFGVFALLASAPDFRASREELVDILWSQEPDGVVRRNFHPTLSHLRRTLRGGLADAPPPLILQNGIYSLNLEIDWRIDLLRFERLVDQGDERAALGDPNAAIELWRAAWAEYRGPFLEGHYASWVQGRREELNRRYLTTLLHLGEAYVVLGEIEGAMDAYRTLLIADPLQERVHLALMRLYGRQGRRDLARRQYERLRTILDEELGIEPMHETLAEYQRLIG